MRSIYRPTRVQVKAYGKDDSLLTIKNAQTVVDSTGKAQDVLKRLQVRVPSRNSYSIPPFAAEATGKKTGGNSAICKQITAYPGSFKSDC